MKKIYLATPYSHPDKKVMRERFEVVNKKAGELMLEGNVVFSPISHSHPVAQTMDEKLVCDHELWMKQDMPFLEFCDELWVLHVEGWHLSLGVKTEMARAKRLKMPIMFVKP